MKQLAFGMLLGIAATLAQGPDRPQGPGKVPAERPAAPPAGAKLPPVEEPWLAEVDRSDIRQRFTPDDPQAGIYELRSRGMGGLLLPDPGTGFLVIGRRHLLLCLQGPGPDPKVPLIRAGVRRFVRSGDDLRMTVVIGHYNVENGDMKLEIAGTEETRRMHIVGSLLRVEENKDNWLEFARVE
jgi:hypothetical protein